MKLAVVVQRYGADLNGGAELHARYIAERLAKHVEVEVLTTCAEDYISWHNQFEPGVEQINGVPVRRFPVSRERNVEDFGRRSIQIFEHKHSLAAELAWLRSEGPTSPKLINHLRRHNQTYDYCLFFSYRYYHSYHGIRATSPKAILVPTAERDPALGLRIFRDSFRSVRALMYNSPEEQTLIQAVSDNGDVPCVVVGVGSEIKANPEPERFRQTSGIKGPVMIYIGRIDKNKGCGELFDYFQRYSRLSPNLTLVLIGKTVIPIPDHPKIRHLGFVTDQQKFDALAASDLLVMPSYYESLSMVTLEAWALGRPVLANGRCDVLCGQSIRSNAGLYYENYEEFAETLQAILLNRTLQKTLGQNGQAYFGKHYSWPVIERKYLDVLDLLDRETTGPPRKLQPLPGWFGRHRADLPPSRSVVEGLPSGPVLPSPTSASSQPWVGFS